MRDEIRQLLMLGPLPDASADPDIIGTYESLLRRISPPLTDEEAKALITLFPADDDTCFGLVWRLVHLIETAPHWPLAECLQDVHKPWILHLRGAAERAGFQL